MRSNRGGPTQHLGHGDFPVVNLRDAGWPGGLFDVLDRAATRGIDTRLIFWRPDEETEALRRNAFWGSTAQIELLDQRRSGVKIRWDRAYPGFCQHQKCWLID